MIEKEYLEPNEGFSQTVVVKTGNFKTLYISGQIGDGADLEAQPYNALIGRDILSNCTLIYNGWDNSYQLHL
jgi:enamine deaminase RidA (YjgF/YER057c/UK114 family)